jgi:mannosyltransferase OCH1-like enzyme
MTQIPKIVHQVWFDMGNGSTVPDKYKPMNESKKLHLSEENGWTFVLWNEKMAMDLLTNDYPWFIPYYNSYKNTICRIDAIRYFILHKYGGIYMDQDLTVYKPIDPLLIDKETLFIHECQTCKKTLKDSHNKAPLYDQKLFSVNNYFMAAVPNHPVFKFIMNQLVMAHKSWFHLKQSYYSVLWVTGPVFLSECLRKYGKLNPGVNGKSLGIYILPQFSFWIGSMDNKQMEQAQMRSTVAQRSNEWYYGAHEYHGTWFTTDKMYDHLRIGSVLVAFIAILVVIYFRFANTR